MRSLLLLLLSGVALAQYDCNVCQNSPDGFRTLKNPTQVFVMENGKSWKCGQLQEMVRDIQPTSNKQEAYFCRDYQVMAEIYGCACNGPAVESLLNGPFKNVNPSCQLCAGGDFNYVPNYMLDTAIQIPGWGVVNCGGLYDAALNGNLLNAANCGDVTPYFSAGCCNFPDSNKIGFNSDKDSNNSNSSPAPPPSSTGTCAHKPCSNDSNCCAGYTCRSRSGTKVCSKQSTARDRISDRSSGASRTGGRNLRLRFDTKVVL